MVLKSWPLIISIIFLVFAQAAKSADFETGSEAWDAGDYQKALEEWMPLAEAGHVEAQFKLGEAYRLGRGVLEDTTYAAHWYILAAEQGHIDAQGFLVWMYSSGEGVARNSEEAMKWALIAGKTGNAGAQLRLANIYKRGSIVAQNFIEARKWYRLAAEQGNAAARSLLGHLLLWGYDGFPKDKSEAIQWLRLAALQGFEDAKATLGVLYARGEWIPTDRVHAEMWLRFAADERGDLDARAWLLNSVLVEATIGYADAQNLAGEYTTIPEDAVQWFLLAAKQGHPSAQNNIGLAYTFGRGVTADPSEALRWFRRAAEQGSAKAQMNVGSAFQYGIGVQINFVEAEKWYRMAAEQGLIEAQFVLDFSFSEDMTVEKRIELVSAWHDELFELGYTGPGTVYSIVSSEIICSALSTVLELEEVPQEVSSFFNEGYQRIDHLHSRSIRVVKLGLWIHNAERYHSQSNARLIRQWNWECARVYEAPFLEETAEGTFYSVTGSVLEVYGEVEEGFSEAVLLFRTGLRLS